MSNATTNEALQRLRGQVISAGVASVTPLYVESASWPMKFKAAWAERAPCSRSSAGGSSPI